MNKSRSAAMEVVLAFTLIMALIWIIPRDFAIIVGILGLGLILISWFLQDDWKTVGLLPDDFSQAKPIFFLVLISVALMIIAALAINPGFLGTAIFWKKVSKQFNSYLGWALFQQLLLNGYFANRLEKVFHSPWPSALTAGSLFAVVHFPNPVLFVGTLIFGTAMSYFFLKSRNLYILALAHAILGTAIKYLIAEGLLEHPLRVGPEFWK